MYNFNDSLLSIFSYLIKFYIICWEWAEVNINNLKLIYLIKLWDKVSDFKVFNPTFSFVIEISSPLTKFATNTWVFSVLCKDLTNYQGIGSQI